MSSQPVWLYQKQTSNLVILHPVNQYGYIRNKLKDLVQTRSHLTQTDDANSTQLDQTESSLFNGTATLMVGRSLKEQLKRTTLTVMEHPCITPEISGGCADIDVPQSSSSMLLYVHRDHKDY